MLLRSLIGAQILVDKKSPPVTVTVTVTASVILHIAIIKIFYVCDAPHTAILIMIESQLQVFQRFPSSKRVLKTVESCFAAFNYHENGSTCKCGSASVILHIGIIRNQGGTFCAVRLRLLP
jgi:hypothetical protein